VTLRPGAGNPGPAARVSNAVLALLYFLLAGMVLYFRFGPFARVIDRFRGEGAQVPSLYVWGGTAVLGGVALFLVWRGWRFLRRARG
jgi:hypothetical protein